MNILLLGATGSIGDSVLSVIEENHSELNLFGITFHKNINKSQEIIKAFKPEFAQAHYNMGNTLKKLERLDEALASHNKAIALKPDYTEAYTQLGNILRDQGKLEEAEISTRKAIEHNPRLTNP